MSLTISARTPPGSALAADLRLWGGPSVDLPEDNRRAARDMADDPRRFEFEEAAYQPAEGLLLADHSSDRCCASTPFCSVRKRVSLPEARPLRQIGSTCQVFTLIRT